MTQEFNNKEMHIQALLGILVLKHYMNKKNIKKRRKSKFQKTFLQNIFQLTKFPSYETLLDISILLNLDSNSINVWFQNTRHIDKLKTLSNKCEKNRIYISPLILYRIYSKVFNEQYYKS